MLKAKYPAVIFFMIVIFAVAIPLIYYPKLPEQLASHFNANGQADGWQSKNSFVITQVALTLLMAAIFGVLAVMVSKLPKSMINMPNKDYWLNDENKESTYTLIQRFLFWLGSITLAFVALTFQETLTANLSGTNKLGDRFWIYFAVYIIATIFYVVKFVLHFSKKNNSN